MDMTIGFANEFCSAVAMQSNRDLVGHGSSWHENRRFFAKKVCCRYFKFSKCGVDIDDVIAYFRVRDSLQHALSGLGNGVAAKIDKICARCHTVGFPLVHKKLALVCVLARNSALALERAATKNASIAEKLGDWNEEGLFANRESRVHLFPIAANLCIFSLWANRVGDLHLPESFNLKKISFKFLVLSRS